MFKTVYIVPIFVLDTVKILEQYSTQDVLLNYVKEKATVIIKDLDVSEFKSVMDKYETDQAMQFRELKIAFIGSRL